MIAIDELNELFAYPDIAREFLLLLRTWSERAKESDADINPWHKLRLVTVHSTEILGWLLSYLNLPRLRCRNWQIGGERK